MSIFRRPQRPATVPAAFPTTPPTISKGTEGGAAGVPAVAAVVTKAPAPTPKAAPVAVKPTTASKLPVPASVHVSVPVRVTPSSGLVHALLSDPSVLGLGFHASGALLVIAHYFLHSGRLPGSPAAERNVSVIELRRLLASRGLENARIPGVIDTLKLHGLIGLSDDGDVTLPEAVYKHEHAQLPDALPEALYEAERPQSAEPAEPAPAMLSTDSGLFAGLDPVPTTPSPKSGKLKPRPAGWVMDTDDEGNVFIRADDEDQTPVVVEIILESGLLSRFTQAYMDTLKPVYPKIDVVEQALRAGQWCKDSPSQRKTANGIRRYLSGWLARASEKVDLQRVVFEVDRAGGGRARPGNGFGQGGRYAEPAPGTPEAPATEAMEAMDDLGGLDGLEDLEALASGESR
jgi:hypothetical protein